MDVRRDMSGCGCRCKWRQVRDWWAVDWKWDIVL